MYHYYIIGVFGIIQPNLCDKKKHRVPLPIVQIKTRSKRNRLRTISDTLHPPFLPSGDPYHKCKQVSSARRLPQSVRIRCAQGGAHVGDGPLYLVILGPSYPSHHAHPFARPAAARVHGWAGPGQPCGAADRSFRFRISNVNVDGDSLFRNNRSSVVPASVAKVAKQRRLELLLCSSLLPCCGYCRYSAKASPSLRLHPAISLCAATPRYRVSTSPPSRHNCGLAQLAEEPPDLRGAPIRILIARVSRYFHMMGFYVYEHNETPFGLCDEFRTTQGARCETITDADVAKIQKLLKKSRGEIGWKKMVPISNSCVPSNLLARPSEATGLSLPTFLGLGFGSTGG